MSNMKNYEQIIKYGSWLLIAVITAVCAFFIVHNAQWVLGDDATVMAYSGWGKWFPMSQTVHPEIGRFFPLTYQMYNFYAPFFNGQMSAQAMYIYHAIVFALSVGLCFYLIQDILRKREAWLRFGIAILATVFFIGRVFPSFMNCFSTAWFGTFLTVLMLVLAYLFYTRKQWWYGVAAFLVVVWITYTGENAFVTPLAWGTCGLLLMWKNSTKEERWFHIGLVADAIVFLLVYFFFIYLRITNAYDAAHGEDVTHMGNIVKILIAQKFLWVAIIMFGVRVWDVLKNKADIVFYDLFLLTAGAICVGGFILRLNWVMYYNGAVLIALPAVIYFLNMYLKPHWTLLLMLVFAGWYGLKVPKTVRKCDRDRQDCHQFMMVLTKQMNGGQTIYLYMPGEEVDTCDGEGRRWLYCVLDIFTGYYTQQKGLRLEQIHVFDGRPGVYVTIDKNEVLSEMGNTPVEAVGTKIAHNEMRKMDAWLVE